MTTDFVVVIVLFALLLVLSVIPRYVDRFVHWRGPQEGARDDVQRKHLELFEEPEDREGGVS